MAGEIISVVAQASTSSTWVDTPVLSSPPEADAARLSDLLSTQAPQAPVPPSVTQAPGNSLGDAILRSMDSAGKSYKDKSLEVDQLMGLGTNVTPAELLRMQFRLIEASLHVDLISKAVSKAGQHIDQLTKLQ